VTDKGKRERISEGKKEMIYETEIQQWTGKLSEKRDG